MIGKSGGKTPLGRSRRRWKNNIRMDLREREWNFVNCIHRAQGRNKVEESSCEHDNEPSGSIKGGKILDCLSDC